MKKNAALVLALLKKEKYMTAKTAEDGFNAERRITFNLEEEDILMGEALVNGTAVKRGRTRVPLDFEDPEQGLEGLEDMLCTISAFINPLVDVQFLIYDNLNSSPVDRFDLVHVPNLAPQLRHVALAAQ